MKFGNGGSFSVDLGINVNNVLLICLNVDLPWKKSWINPTTLDFMRDQKDLKKHLLMPFGLDDLFGASEFMMPWISSSSGSRAIQSFISLITKFGNHNFLLPVSFFASQYCYQAMFKASMALARDLVANLIWSLKLGPTAKYSLVVALFFLNLVLKRNMASPRIGSAQQLVTSSEYPKIFNVDFKRQKSMRG